MMNKFLLALIFLLLVPKTSYALKVEVGNFEITTAGGTPQTVNFADSTLNPNIVIFYTGLIQKDDTAVSSGQNGIDSFGAMIDSTHRFAVSTNARDGQGTSVTWRSSDTDEALAQCRSVDEDYHHLADFDNISTGSFGVSFSKNPIYDKEVNYIAIEGVSAQIGTFDSPATPGDVSVTGLSFQPDVIIVVRTNPNKTEGVDKNASTFSLGVATSPTSEWGIFRVSGGGLSTTDTARYASSTYSALQYNLTSLTEYGDLKSIESDGFTYQFGAIQGSGMTYHYIALGGVTAEAGLTTSVTTTPATKKITLSNTFRPALVLMAHISSGTEDASVDHAVGGVGASSGTSHQVAYNYIDYDGVSTSSVQKRHNESALVTGYYDATDNYIASLYSFDSDGFTLNWSTVDSTSRNFYYLALGETDTSSFEGATIQGATIY